MNKIFWGLENLISGILPLCFLTICGMIFTFKTRGVQFRKFFAAIKFALFSERKGKGSISSFGAVCNSLAATVGTGNIAGVAAAISIGGAGAVFWMWVSAFLSMAVKALEITLSVATRKEENSRFIGGPMWYIKYGLGKKFVPLAAVFSALGTCSAFATGNITQINACVSVMSENMSLKVLIGIIFTIVTAIVIVGGAKKITQFTTVVLPLMAVLYIVLCLGVIIKNTAVLGDAFLSILKGAFLPKAVTGGAVGSVLGTVITGAQKGIFSNEAGLGTAGIAHALAEDAKPQTQGLFGIFEVFVDTLLICTLTALTILCSGVIIDYNNVASSSLVANALTTLYGSFSRPVLFIMLCMFGISSVIGWAAYGIAFAEFLFLEKGRKAFVIIYPFFCMVGAVMNVGFAWRVAEFFNGIMLCINLFAVLCLCEKPIGFLKGERDERKNSKITGVSVAR